MTKENGNGYLDSIFNTGLGIAKERFGKPDPSPSPSPRESVGPQANQPDWKQIGLIGGAALAVLVVLMMVLRR